MMNFAHSRISIGGIVIQNEDHLSKAAIGANILIKKAVSGKKNQGVGQQNADQTTVFAPISVVIDDEELDFPSFKTNW
ncbi:hypothetical protein ACQYAD_11300 [Neobacillus sp. SM06]|uniref:hypothetical protein n=1 Tax=Neobacillus sp. SM06 TaxID=3422492 RepID=UPI003D26C284